MFYYHYFQFLINYVDDSGPHLYDKVATYNAIKIINNEIETKLLTPNTKKDTDFLDNLEMGDRYYMTAGFHILWKSNQHYITNVTNYYHTLKKKIKPYLDTLGMSIDYFQKNHLRYTANSAEIFWTEIQENWDDEKQEVKDQEIESKIQKIVLLQTIYFQQHPQNKDGKAKNYKYPDYPYPVICNHYHNNVVDVTDAKCAVLRLWKSHVDKERDNKVGDYVYNIQGRKWFEDVMFLAGIAFEYKNKKDLNEYVFFLNSESYQTFISTLKNTIIDEWKLDEKMYNKIRGLNSGNNIFNIDHKDESEEDFKKKLTQTATNFNSFTTKIEKLCEKPIINQ